MPRILGKNLRFFFSKPKNNISTQFPPTPDNQIPSSSTFYDHPSSSSTSKSFTSTSNLISSDSDSDSLTPDFAAILASQRFFFSSPGHSNSIADTPITGGVPFRTYSPDPYIDFRQSMVEMVEAKELFDVKADWDGLYELLSCYLHLNPECTHRFIIAAFSDVLVSLTSSMSDHSCRKSDVCDNCAISNRVDK